jgi:hypothetical protein
MVACRIELHASRRDRADGSVTASGGPSKHLDVSLDLRSCCHAGVKSDQRNAKSLGQRDIGGSTLFALGCVTRDRRGEDDRE